MTSKPLRLLDLKGDPLTIGQEHGETARDQIREIAEIRLDRMCNTSAFSRQKDVFELAAQHVPILKNFDDDLYLELKGISEGSNVSLANLVVLNNFTDMRDIDRSFNKDDGGCSIIFNPTDNGPVLGQTWDIHSSAKPYVIMLKINDTLLFSITGCLGMTGLNHQGVAIAINNLVSNDAKVGVIWPAAVRKALTAKSAILAKEEIMNAPLGSGRHFAITDQKDFFSIEASGIKKKLVFAEKEQLHIHTNHCLDEEMGKTHIILKESTSIFRYQQLDEVVRHMDLSSAEKIFLALAKVSIPENFKEPHRTATCGTFVMDINKKFVLGCEGIANEQFLKQKNTKVYI